MAPKRSGDTTLTRYRWDGERFVDREGNLMPVPQRAYVPSPYVVSDVTYKSPLSGKEITSRSQRREEMKVHGVREVDPSEFRPTYNTKKWAERMKGDHDPLPRPDLGEGYTRPGRDELPEKIKRSIERSNT